MQTIGRRETSNGPKLGTHTLSLVPRQQLVSPLVIRPLLRHFPFSFGPTKIVNCEMCSTIFSKQDCQLVNYCSQQKQDKQESPARMQESFSLFVCLFFRNFRWFLVSSLPFFLFAFPAHNQIIEARSRADN